MTDYKDLERAAQRQEVNLLCLAKVGQEEHLQLLRQGKLRCRSLSFYKQVDGQPKAHQDANEGIAGIYQSSRVSIRFKAPDGQEIAINAENGLIGEVLVSIDHPHHIFSMHAIHTGSWTDRTFGDDQLEEFKAALQVPGSMNKFGQYIWVVANGHEFFERIRKACRANKLSCRGDFVRYVDAPTVHGSLSDKHTAFVKLSQFREEREYRFLFSSKSPLPDPYVLDVGSLEDISFVVSLDQFRAGWNVDFQSD